MTFSNAGSHFSGSLQGVGGGGVGGEGRGNSTQRHSVSVKVHELLGTTNKNKPKKAHR